MLPEPDPCWHAQHLRSLRSEKTMSGRPSQFASKTGVGTTGRFQCSNAGLWCNDGSDAARPRFGLTLSPPQSSFAVGGQCEQERVWFGRGIDHGWLGLYIYIYIYIYIGVRVWVNSGIPSSRKRSAGAHHNPVWYHSGRSTRVRLEPYNLR